MSQTPDYDIVNFPSPHLAVDVVLVTLADDAMKVLMMRRTSEPFAGQLVLPGGFVREHETLEATARWILAQKTLLPDLAVEQLFTFSDPGRDPRGWVVSVAYFALVPTERLRRALHDHPCLELVTIAAPPAGAIVLTGGGRPVEPGFDHSVIIATAVERIRGKLDWSMAAFALLPDRFTLFDLQRVHEVILGRPLNKPHFRKRMLGRAMPDGRRLAATGEFARGRHRPAELYELQGNA
jgi:8-oxo-dGTP diphosphatase